MTYAAIRSEKHPEEDGQCMTYMDHILTMHAQKRPLVWLEYRFRVRRERTGVSWNVFNYPLYASVKLNVKLEQLIHLSHRSCFVTVFPEAHDSAPPASVTPLTRENVLSGNAALYTDAPFVKKEGHSQLVCRSMPSHSKTYYKPLQNNLKCPFVCTNAKWSFVCSVAGTRQETNQHFTYRFHWRFSHPFTIPSDQPKYDYENHKFVWDTMGLAQHQLEKEKAKQIIAGLTHQIPLNTWFICL